MITSKPSLRSGFDCIIRPAPSGPGRTTPSQSGHYPLINSWNPRYVIERHRSRSTLAQIMACCQMAPSHYLNQCWLIIKGVLWHSPESNFTVSVQAIVLGLWGWKSYFKIIVTTLIGQWVNSLWPSDAVWQQRPGSTLAQVMACCLTAPSHYLNQCWLIISKVFWHSSEDIIKRFEDTLSNKARLKITFLKSHKDLPGANELKTISHKPLGLHVFSKQCLSICILQTWQQTSQCENLSIWVRQLLETLQEIQSVLYNINMLPTATSDIIYKVTCAS